MAASARAPRVYEQIVAHVERGIYDGQLRQGQKLPPERQLARDLKASRVAVREALRTLELRGLVEVRQGSTGGYFVRELDNRPLVRDFGTLLRLGRVSRGQLLEARRLIEPELASLAAQRATDTELKHLLAVIEQTGGPGAAGGDLPRIDVDFHRLLAETARNPVLTVVTHALMALEADAVVPRSPFTEADHRELEAAHRRIFEAVAARKAGEAREIMAIHIEDVQARLDRAARSE
jgi:DNA-binding FadR family transcriptional regulator